MPLVHGTIKPSFTALSGLRLKQVEDRDPDEGGSTLVQCFLCKGMCLMAATIFSTSEVRSKISTILARLQKTKKPVFIARRGKAEAVLLSIERYNAMIDLLEDREDELDMALGQRIREERQAYAAGEGRDLENLLAGLDSSHASG